MECHSEVTDGIETSQANTFIIMTLELGPHISHSYLNLRLRLKTGVVDYPWLGLSRRVEVPFEPTG